MLIVDIQKRIKTAIGDGVLNVHAEFQNDSITGVFGNSGEGKTTLLNLISGLSSPEKGTITFNDKSWCELTTKTNVLPQNRNVGYLFQNDSLFPHFTVKQNILYPLSKKERKVLDLNKILSQVEMVGFEDTYPKMLSGGQKQRVAIARALAQKTKLLLLDEPFSALDLEIKNKLYKLIRSFRKEFSLTILIVTHDVNDIYALCDNVVWIKNHSAEKLYSLDEFKIQIDKIMIESI